MYRADSDRCVICGDEIGTESGKQYCFECEKRWLGEKNSTGDNHNGDGDKAKSEK